MEKKMSEKELKLLLILGAVIIIILAYNFGYVKFNDKTDKVEEEIITLNSKLADLEEKVANEGKYKKEIKEKKAKMEEVLAVFPEKVTAEKEILIAKEEEDENKDTWINKLNFDVTQAFYEPTKKVEQPVLDDAGNETGEVTTTEVSDKSGLIGYNTLTTVGFESTYKGLKECIDFYHSYSDRMTIQSLKANYNTDSGNLTTEMILNVYGVSGTGKEYESPEVSGVTIGNKNIFGSMEATEKDK